MPVSSTAHVMPLPSDPNVRQQAVALTVSVGMQHLGGQISSRQILSTTSCIAASSRMTSAASDAKT